MALQIDICNAEKSRTSRKRNKHEGAEGSVARTKLISRAQPRSSKTMCWTVTNTSPTCNPEQKCPFDEGKRELQLFHLCTCLIVCVLVSDFRSSFISLSISVCLALCTRHMQKQTHLLNVLDKYLMQSSESATCSSLYEIQGVFPFLDIPVVCSACQGKKHQNDAWSNFKPMCSWMCVEVWLLFTSAWRMTRDINWPGMEFWQLAERFPASQQPDWDLERWNLGRSRCAQWPCRVEDWRGWAGSAPRLWFWVTCWNKTHKWTVPQENSTNFMFQWGKRYDRLNSPFCHVCRRWQFWRWPLLRVSKFPFSSSFR